MLVATAGFPYNSDNNKKKEGYPDAERKHQAIRKSKGLSQEDLAVRLNVVRQTISKWENGLSVPDADMLISLSEVLETPVSTLLGETAARPETGDLKAICEKLETVNLQLARRKDTARKMLRGLLLGLCAAIALLFGVLGRVKQSVYGLGLWRSGTGCCRSGFSCV